MVFKKGRWGGRKQLFTSDFWKACEGMVLWTHTIGRGGGRTYFTIKAIPKILGYHFKIFGKLNFLEKPEWCHKTANNLSIPFFFFSNVVTRTVFVDHSWKKILMHSIITGVLVDMWMMGSFRDWQWSYVDRGKVYGHVFIASVYKYIFLK